MSLLREYVMLVAREAGPGLSGLADSDAALSRGALDLLRVGHRPDLGELSDPQVRAAWLGAARELDEERAQRVAGLVLGERLTPASAAALMVRK